MTRAVIAIAIAAHAVIAPHTAAQVIDNHYLDPQYLDKISKFRSCAGHHYGYDQTFIDLGLYEVETDPTETNRSMKHYFSPLESFSASGSNNTLELYAPFDGQIHRVTDEGHDSGYINKQVWIQSKVSPDIFAILFHVNLLEVFPNYWNDWPPEYWPYHGANDSDFDRLTVSSGEVIGYADLRGTISDIAILQKVSDTEYHYLSYFDETIMTEELFATFRKYDLTSREDVIISKEFRNSNPLPEDCWGNSRADDWFSLATSNDGAVNESDDTVFRLALEEPVDGEIHSGVGNLRGWAVASSGITKVEILVDGVYAFDAPYGASRGDVGGAFPDVEDSENSGYSLAYAYSLLSAGEHTITARAHSELGTTIERSNTFTVVKFRSADYISDPDAVDLNSASCSVSDDEILVIDSIVDEMVYDLKLKWRTAEQGFEIIEVR